MKEDNSQKSFMFWSVWGLRNEILVGVSAKNVYQESSFVYLFHHGEEVEQVHHDLVSIQLLFLFCDWKNLLCVYVFDRDDQETSPSNYEFDHSSTKKGHRIEPNEDRVRHKDLHGDYDHHNGLTESHRGGQSRRNKVDSSHT